MLIQLDLARNHLELFFIGDICTSREYFERVIVVIVVPLISPVAKSTAVKFSTAKLQIVAV